MAKKGMHRNDPSKYQGSGKKQKSERNNPADVVETKK